MAVKNDKATTVRKNTKICVPLAFLIGVPRDRLTYLTKVEKDKECITLRTLSSLRSAIMQNYDVVSAQMKEGRELVDIPYLTRLVGSVKGLDIEIAGSTAVEVLIFLNKAISEIAPGVCARVFPEELSERLAKLFKMPLGDTPSGVKAAIRGYKTRYSHYPYQKWLNWDFDKMRAEDRAEYILGNDTSFLIYLEEQDQNKAQGLELFNFLSEGSVPVAVIDSENSDPEKAYGLLSEYGAKISKVVVIYDPHSSALWKSFVGKLAELGIEVESQESSRLKEQKSLVDLDMAMRIAKEYYGDGTRRFLLFTSDSDIWGVIRSYPDAGFLLLFEQEKLGDHLSAALADKGIPKCCIDEYGTSDSLLTEAIVKEGLKLLSQETINAAKTVVHAASNLGVYVEADQIPKLADLLLDSCYPKIDHDAQKIVVEVE